MSVNRLLSQIATQGVKPRRAALARWTDTPAAGSWEPEPVYGAFIDDEGLVVPGVQPARAFLSSSDPSRLELALDGDHGTVVFVDWGQQSLPWKDIFVLWDNWEKEDLIADCGAVATTWTLENTWVSPGWIAFKGEFDGAPLTTTVVRGVETGKTSPFGKEAPTRKFKMPIRSTSFLAMAKAIRGETVTVRGVPAGNYPMLPFTLNALHDPRHPWPQGV